MSELDFEVERTSFVVSVIDIIEEYIKAEFLFDYEKQKENFQHIYNNLKYLKQSMPIENAEVMVILPFLIAVESRELSSQS